MVKVRRWISSSKVREMCIRYNYYTCGDCIAYDAMLMAADNMDADDYVGLLTIANDIYSHSKMREDEEYSKNDMVAGIIYDLLKECTDMYVEIEGEV